MTRWIAWRRRLEVGRPEMMLPVMAVAVGRSSIRVRVASRGERARGKERRAGRRGGLTTGGRGGPGVVEEQRRPRRHGAQGRHCGASEDEGIFAITPLLHFVYFYLTLNQ